MFNQEVTDKDNKNNRIDIFIGEKIRLSRKKLGLSQSQLASLIGVSYQQVQKYENGVTKLSVSNLLDIATILGVDLGYFYSGYELKKKQNETHLNGIINLQKRLSELKILLVEDSASDEILIQKSLQKSKYKTSTVSFQDGLEALSFLRGKNQQHIFARPDLIILDINVPKISGLELLKEMKNDRKLKAIPVIILTNSVIAEQMEEVYKNQASGFIHKALDFEIFCKRINLAIEYWSDAVILPDN